MSPILRKSGLPIGRPSIDGDQGAKAMALRERIRRTCLRERRGFLLNFLVLTTTASLMVGYSKILCQCVGRWRIVVRVAVL